jgi:hypothetical protein
MRSITFHQGSIAGRPAHIENEILALLAPELFKPIAKIGSRGTTSASFVLLFIGMPNRRPWAELGCAWRITGHNSTLPSAATNFHHLIRQIAIAFPVDELW